MTEVLQFSEYPPEIVFQAQELYCVDRLTYEAVSTRLKIAQSTLKRWGKDYDWRGKREQLARAEADIRANTYLARAKMLAKVVDEGGALDAFAVAKLETLALDQARFKIETAPESASAAPVAFDTPAQAAELLEKTLEKRLGSLLANPETINLKAIKELRDCFDYLAQMRGRSDDETEAGKPLSPDNVAHIKNILAGGL